MFRSISCGINNTKEERERRRWQKETAQEEHTARETINYRSSALSLEIPAELLATDILNLHRRPGKSFVRISLRESRARVREDGGGSLRSVIHFASTNLEKVILSARAPVVYSQTHSVNASGTLISSFPPKPVGPMCILAIKFSYPFNKVFDGDRLRRLEILPRHLANYIINSITLYRG